jgi:hypothetical protein
VYTFRKVANATEDDDEEGFVSCFSFFCGIGVKNIALCLAVSFSRGFQFSHLFILDFQYGIEESLRGNIWYPFTLSICQFCQ